MQALDDKVLNRRSFLKLGASAALTISGIGAVEVVKNNEKHESLTLAPDQRVGVYNFFDYRDVVIAEGVHQLSLELETGGSVALIFGKGHIDGVKYYLENPQVRNAKLALYKPYKDKSKAVLTVNEFVCDEDVSDDLGENGNWGQWRESDRKSLF
jgi:hypothetical protein